MSQTNNKVSISVGGVTMALLAFNEGPISPKLLKTFAAYYRDSHKQISLHDYPELKPLVDRLVQKGTLSSGPQQTKYEPEAMSHLNVYTIELSGGDKSETATIKLSRVNTECQIEMDYLGETIRAIDKNFFYAFCQIRNRLEQDGLYPICYGASLNVYPSASLMEESGGLIAYRLPKGAMPSADDIVSIFSTGQDVIAVSVKEQRAYFESWPG